MPATNLLIVELFSLSLETRLSVSILFSVVIP